MKVSDLSGIKLDFWVAKAEGYNPKIEDDGVWLYPAESTMPVWYEPSSTSSGSHVICLQFHPSRSWHEGGPIIERENIQISPPTTRVHVLGGPNAGWQPSGFWSSTIWRKGPDDKRHVCFHETSPLIAAMRAYVASRFGEDVPDQQEN